MLLTTKMNSTVLFACFFFVLALPAVADTFTFDSNFMSTSTARGGEKTILRGDAVITSDATTIHADTIELYGPDFRYAQADGNVRIIDTSDGLDITCNSLFYDREDEFSRVSGNSVLEDKENEMIIKSGYMESRTSSDIAVFQISVRILREDLVCRSEFARFDREKNILELSGLPVVYQDGDEYRASKISINLDTEDIKLEGDVSGIIESSRDADEDKAPSPEAGEGDKQQDENAGQEYLPESGDLPIKTPWGTDDK